MAIIGKVIGVILGSWLFGLPFGTLLGLVLGHLYDSGYYDMFLGKSGRRHSRQSGTVQQLFFDCTFSILGYIAKADGRVSNLEIQFAEQVMLQMQLTGSRRERAIEQFNLGKSADFDYQATLSGLRRACWFQPGLLRTFLDIQVRAANVDGKMSGATQDALRRVFAGLGIPNAVYEQYSRQSQAGYNYQRHGRNAASPDPKAKLKEAYTILQVSASAGDAEVKKAYRRMMSKNHPDRLMSKGVPPEMIKLATQKTQQTKDAYDTIKQSRGMS